MITTSDKYKTAVNKSGRHFRCKIDIGGITYTGIKGLKIKGGTNSSDEITFGDTVSSFMEFTLTDVPKNTLLKGKKAILYIGLDLIDGTTEWIKKGVYHLEKPIKTGEYIKITAYDNFSLCNKGFFTDLKGNQKIKTILDDLCKKIGITFAGGADDVSYNVDKLKGMTMREAVGVLAAYCGKNAIMDSNGNLKFVWYTDTKISISPSRYADPLETAEDDTYINRLDCAIENEKSLSAGTGIGIYFSCPGMTQTRLNTLYDRIKGFTYRALTLDFKMARPDIEAGDLIKVVDKDGTVYNVPLMEYEFNCDGGYYGSVISKGKSEEEQENEYKGPLQTKVERTYSDLISTKQLLADKITAYEGEFEIINTNYLEVNKKFTAMEAEIENLDVTELTAKVAKIETSYVSKEYVQELYATKAEVHVLDVDLERVNTLLAGSVTAGSTQTIVLNADNTTISNALIKSAMIDSVAADKVTAGTIDASRIHFKSQSGRLDIFGETLQVRDADRVRVQIGKDGTGDYALSQWDADGNLMWDSRGAKAAAIKDKIIVNDMVSDNAGIDGKKINITSLVKEINDGSEVITSNHILYDGKSLDIVFDTISTKIDHLKIGGKNLLLYSDEKVTNDQYLIKTYTMTEKMTSGEVYAIRIWGKLGENKSYFTAYLDGGNTQLAILTKQNDGTYAATFDGIEGNLANSIIYIYVYDGNVVSTSTIEKIKLEKGNKYTDCTPAPEDINNTISGVDTKVTAVTETVKSHSTQLTAQDGKIATLITDTTQVKKDIIATQGEVTAAKGSITTLQTNYSALDQSVKGLSSTVASHTSSITDFGTKITAVTDKATKLELSLDGFKTTVSDTYATKTQVTAVDEKFDNYSTTATMNSAINQKAGEISATISKVETTANSTSSKLTELIATVDGINVTVAKKTDKGTIISTINQSAETVKIQANRLDLIGKVTIGMLDINTQSIINGVKKWSYNNDITYIDGGKIYTGTINAAQIAANAVTASKINVSSLSAITANLGTVTAGSLTSKTVINVTTDLTIGNNIYINQNTKGTKYIKFTADNWIRSWVSSEWEYIIMESSGVSSIGATGATKSASVNALVVTGKSEVQINGTDRISINSNFTEVSSGLYMLNGGIHFNANNKSVYAYATNGKEYTQLTLLNGDDNCVLGYGTYANNIGNLNLYGYNINLTSKTAIKGNKAYTNTSDKRLKYDIRNIADELVAVWYEIMPKQFRWREINGDDGKVHFGIIAQDLIRAMEKHGLDYRDYGFISKFTLGENSTEEYLAVTYDYYNMLTSMALRKNMIDQKNIYEKYNRRLETLEKQLDDERQLRIKAEQKLNAIISGEIRVLSRTV
ncbi:tail fiber domain-containing protein [Longicatena caecimuris]|uniref:Endosialidase-like protein n=1 Tax=Longicatena caecimuris TaxID=1796635 RepID=A0A4R3TFI1_9FIRM|nr:tail fiber domain-containing protein [Longicatena caecimuris]MCR1870174.1 tail fiber domain-containing protein [Longicatena caecimuris]MCU0102691.1 tail fiber domain-containing protein [Longicatena caecimuris]TCU60026.1 endosialidase-like protein [Longicatena caecimuris]